MYVCSCKRKVKSFKKKGYHQEIKAWEWGQTRGKWRDFEKRSKIAKANRRTGKWGDNATIWNLKNESGRMILKKLYDEG